MGKSSEDLINKSGVEPLGDKVLVKPDVTPKMHGGIHIPDQHVERIALTRSKGTVIAVANNCWEMWSGDNWCESGDRILFGKYAGYPFEGDDGEMYQIINDADVTALVTGKIKVDAVDEVAA